MTNRTATSRPMPVCDGLSQRACTDSEGLQSAGKRSSIYRSYHQPLPYPSSLLPHPPSPSPLSPPLLSLRHHVQKHFCPHSAILRPPLSIPSLTPTVQPPRPPPPPSQPPCPLYLLGVIFNRIYVHMLFLDEFSMGTRNLHFGCCCCCCCCSPPPSHQHQHHHPHHHRCCCCCC